MGVRARPDGSGQLAVTVTLDRQAEEAIGGLAGQLQVGDLLRRGWTVVGPTSTAGGGSTVHASHPFASPADLPSLAASLAGSGGSHPFELALSQDRNLWRTDTRLRGSVDLRCGLGCFGDVGLTGQTGSPLGVDVGALSRQAGSDPLRAVTVVVAASLPGTVRGTDATARPAGALEWTPVLGGSLPVSAVTRQWHTDALVATVVGVVVVAAVAVAVTLALWRRRGGRGRVAGGGRGRGGRGGGPRGGHTPCVTCNGE